MPDEVREDKAVSLPEECCTDKGNRDGPFETNSPELTFTICRACGRRHFRLDGRTAFKQLEKDV